MRVTKYNTLLQDGLPVLVKEKSQNYSKESAVNEPKKIAQMLNDVFLAGSQTEEHMWMLALAQNCKLLGIFEISHGTINQSVVGTREIFQKAMLCGAAAIVVAHNHPSGSINPSSDDVNVTRRLYEAGNLMGISLWDHVIVTTDSYYSFKENQNVI